MREPIAYTYEADLHCPSCTEERFGRKKWINLQNFPSIKHQLRVNSALGFL